MIILKMYVMMIPVILAGILNMLFVKTPLYKRLKKPIDCGMVFCDGKQLLGDNKTWVGFIGMVTANALTQLLWGFVCGAIPDMCYLYRTHANTPVFNLLAGAAMGFAYMLFELPNSFIKRRIDIPSGKTICGSKGRFFFLIDQVDSLIGVGAVFVLLTPTPLWQYFLYIVLGALTHITVNLILYKTHIRKNL